MTTGEKKPLFEFGFHAPQKWLDALAQSAKREDWGAGNRTLQTLVDVNYELAKQQDKIIQGEDFAAWRPGYLETATNEPVWLYYVKNNRSAPVWRFDGVRTTAELPEVAGSEQDYEIEYRPYGYNGAWPIDVDPEVFNRKLQSNREVHTGALGGETVANSYRFYRLVCGEIWVAGRNGFGVLPQWHKGSWGYLLPLSLTAANQIDLYACLTTDDKGERYKFSTLLTPPQAYTVTVQAPHG